jgi:hypothetical protein
MNPHEIVVREVQGICGLEIFQLLAESVGQPRQPAHLHPARQILPLDIRDRNHVHVRQSDNPFL